MTNKTPFKLKSGNKPAFKDVGSSPARKILRDRVSEEHQQLKHDDINRSIWEESRSADFNEERKRAQSALVSTPKKSGPTKQKGKKWKQALAKIGNAAVRGLTGGLDAVYGTGKVKSGGGVVFDEGKDNDSNSPEENVKKIKGE